MRTIGHPQRASDGLDRAETLAELGDRLPMFRELTIGRSRTR